MFFNWTFPPEESLVGIIIADNVEIIVDDGTKMKASLVSIGVLIIRIDFIFNKEIIE